MCCAVDPCYNTKEIKKKSQTFERQLYQPHPPQWGYIAQHTNKNRICLRHEFAYSSRAFIIYPLALASQLLLCNALAQTHCIVDIGVLCCGVMDYAPLWTILGFAQTYISHQIGARSLALFQRDFYGPRPG